MGILVATGAILTFNRLTSGFVGGAYVGVLLAKITLAMYMFYLVRFLKSAPGSVGMDNTKRIHIKLLSAASGAGAVVAIGLIVFLLADVLSAIFEMDA